LPPARRRKDDDDGLEKAGAVNCDSLHTHARQSGKKNCARAGTSVALGGVRPTGLVQAPGGKKAPISWALTTSRRDARGEEKKKRENTRGLGCLQK